MKLVSRKILMLGAPIGLLVAVIAGSIPAPAQLLLSSSQQRGQPSEYPDSGPIPSTWKFDNHGNLLSIPGNMDASRDSEGRLTHLKLYTPVKGGMRTTTYTLIRREGDKVDVHESYTQNGDLPLTREKLWQDVHSFSVDAFFIQVQSDGTKVKKVPIPTAEALKSNARTLLGGVKIMCTFETDISLFVGGEYRAHMMF
jgi:hypothetical protein